MSTLRTPTQFSLLPLAAAHVHAYSGIYNFYNTAVCCRWVFLNWVRIKSIRVLHAKPNEESTVGRVGGCLRWVAGRRQWLPRSCQTSASTSQSTSSLRLALACRHYLFCSSQLLLSAERCLCTSIFFFFFSIFNFILIAQQRRRRRLRRYNCAQLPNTGCFTFHFVSLSCSYIHISAVLFFHLLLLLLLLSSSHAAAFG